MKNIASSIARRRYCHDDRGCGSTSRSRTASGTAMGAGAGAIIGSFSGNAARVPSSAPASVRSARESLPSTEAPRAARSSN